MNERQAEDTHRNPLLSSFPLIPEPFVYKALRAVQFNVVLIDLGLRLGQVTRTLCDNCTDLGTSCNVETVAPRT